MSKGGRGEERKAVVGRATAQVASSSSSSSSQQASACCSSSGSSSREVSESGDESPMVPSPLQDLGLPSARYLMGCCWPGGVCVWWGVVLPRLFIHLWLSVRLSVCPP